MLYRVGVAMTRYEGMTPAERVGHVMVRLVQGEELRAADIADDYGVSRRAAYYALDCASRVLPVYSDGGVWRLMDVLVDGLGQGSEGSYAD